MGVHHGDQGAGRHRQKAPPAVLTELERSDRQQRDAQGKAAVNVCPYELGRHERHRGRRGEAPPEREHREEKRKGRCDGSRAR
jgi:hypothetical protein